MGNCLFVEEKVVRLMKIDGKVVEYQAPVKVFQVLSEFKGHVISDSHVAAGTNHLYPHTELLGGRLYHLVPLKAQAPNKPAVKKKKVRFSLPETQEAPPPAAAAAENEPERAAAIEGFTIKLIITKGELRKMIENGMVSMDTSTISAAGKSEMNQKEEVELVVNSDDDDDDGLEDSDDNHKCSRRYLWKPSLVSIPE